jgi:nitrate/nitrite transport system substrate-binding protein
MPSEGLDVQVIKTAGWAVVRDKVINKEYDASHMLSPMPMAMSWAWVRKADADRSWRDREHQRPGDHDALKHKDKWIRRAGRA